MAENKGIMLAKSVQKHAGRAKEKVSVALLLDTRSFVESAFFLFGLVGFYLMTSKTHTALASLA